MSRRPLPLLAATAALAALFAGCETTPDTPAPPPSSPSSPSTPTSPPPTADARAVYYVGSTTVGPRLYREFQRFSCTGAGCLDQRAVQAALTGAARDPDYRSDWPQDAKVRSVRVVGDTITVDLAGSLHDRPSGLSEAAAGMAIQQVLFTAQAAIGKGRMPVQLLLDGGHSDTILGVPTAEPLANDRVLSALAHINLITPAEGQLVTSGRLEVSGVANSFEANVVLRLQRYEGTYIAFQGPVTAEGWQAERLFPFRTTIDVKDLSPGRYVLMAMTDDPSGQGQAFSDDKVVTIRPAQR